MKKSFCLFFLLVGFLCISCEKKSLLNSKNIFDFEMFANFFFQEKAIEVVSRDLDNYDRIFVKNKSGKISEVRENVYTFFQLVPEIGCVSKTVVNLDFYSEYLRDSFADRKSNSVLKFENGLKILLQRDLKYDFSIIKFQKYNKSILFGNYYSGNAYVFSPELDLSILLEDELYVLGFKYVYKTEFENWYYTAPLG